MKQPGPYLKKSEGLEKSVVLIVRNIITLQYHW